MTLHIEWMYGFYRGQDPRTFRPDKESCSEKEIADHDLAISQADAGTWTPDDSGCHHEVNRVLCKSSFGIGTYAYVADSEGEYIRDAAYEDVSRETETWEEDSNG